MWWEEADFVRPIFFLAKGYKVNKVLVIDDCPIICEVIKGALELIGLECDLCEPPIVARDLVIDPVYSTVILDVNIPNVDSIELASVIRSNSLKTQIIVISGKMDEEVFYEFIKFGVNDFFQKDKLNEKVLQESVELGNRRQEMWSSLFPDVK